MQIASFTKSSIMRHNCIYHRCYCGRVVVANLDVRSMIKNSCFCNVHDYDEGSNLIFARCVRHNYSLRQVRGCEINFIVNDTFLTLKRV